MHNGTASVVIGQIGAPYGVKGWVHVRSFTVPTNNLENFSTWQIYCKDETNSKLVQVEQFKKHNNHFVAKLAGVDAREQASLLTNWQISIQRELLPELDSDRHYWTDLLGVTVYNKAGNNLGIVVDFLETGANDVLIVRGVQEHLIPYVRGKHILNVCLSKKVMLVDWDMEL